MSGQVLDPASGDPTASGPAGTSPQDQGTPSGAQVATAQSPSDPGQDSNLRREYTQARQTVTSVARTLGLRPDATQRDILNALARAQAGPDAEEMSDAERERLSRIEEREWDAEIRNYGSIGEHARSIFDSIRFQQLTPAEFMTSFHAAVEDAVEARIKEMGGAPAPASGAAQPQQGQPSVPSADFAGAQATSLGGPVTPVPVGDLKHSGDVRGYFQRLREANPGRV